MPLLMARMENPTAFRDALIEYFASNGAKVTQNKIVADNIIYDQRVGVGSNNITFFDGTFNADNTNIQGGSYVRPDGEHFLVLGMRVLTGASATLKDTDWSYGSGDAIVKAGDLTILNNTEIVLRNFPCTAFNPNLTTDDEGTFWFSEPMIWRGQTSFTINWKGKSAIATANMNVRVELIGVQFIA